MHTQKDLISDPKNNSAVKKGEAKKVQVTERPKGVISTRRKAIPARLHI